MVTSLKFKNKYTEPHGMQNGSPSRVLVRSPLQVPHTCIHFTYNGYSSTHAEHPRPATSDKGNYSAHSVHILCNHLCTA